MILSKTVTFKWSTSNKKRLISRGYTFTRIGKKITIIPKDLSNTSKILIKVKCDYCNIKYTMSWDKYYSRVTNNLFCKKTACGSCNHFKTKEVLLLKYGVNNPSLIDSVKVKRVHTFIQRFGVSNPSMVDSIKRKKQKTTLKTLGVDNPFKSKKIIKRIQISKARALFESNNQSCSKQQKYIAALYKGVINYNVESVNLDISLINKKIYIEYDGSGHTLSVILNNITNKQFQKKELRRYYMLKNKGWKMMRILSTKDLIPSDQKLTQMLKIGKKLLKTHSWVKFNIDNRTIETSQSLKNFEYGILQALPRNKRVI